MKEVILIDLDGTLVETVSGKTFPITEHDWKPILGMYEALKKLRPKFIHIVSNQGGISRGLVNEIRWNMKAEYICECLESFTGAEHVTYDYCTEDNPESFDRKPNPGMFEAYKELYLKMTGEKLNPDTVLMIGDASGRPGQFSDSDLKFAKNCGVDYMDAEEFINTSNP